MTVELRKSVVRDEKTGTSSQPPFSTIGALSTSAFTSVPDVSEIVLLVRTTKA